MLGRRVHEDGALAIPHDPKVAAEAGVTGERQYLGAFPAMGGKESGCGGGRNHRGGNSTSQAGGTRAVKTRSPSSAMDRARRRPHAPTDGRAVERRVGTECGETCS